MGDMRNIVVLKNLPSNFVEEAIVVIKDNQKIRKYEYIENKGKQEGNKGKNTFEDCVKKEAEMVISEYISKIEKNKKNKDNEKFIKKYEKLKRVNIILFFVLCISLMINLI